MRRNIWFRAMLKGTKKWVYGLPCCIYDGIPTAMEFRTDENKISIHRVESDTFCQRISLAGFLCYEKDIVRTPKGVGVVEWNPMEGRYEIILHNGEPYPFDSAFNDLLEIIGNVYENEELLGLGNGKTCD